MDLILCWYLRGAWTGIDWNEFNSLSELERSPDLEHKEEIWPAHQRKRESEIFIAVFIK